MSEGTIVNFFNLKSPIAEAYRTLRTNIQFKVLDYPFKTLLVTSACPGEGKSTTVANLAISFALTGKKVLVVDCDLRKPEQHNIYGFDNGEGLSNLLLGEFDPGRYTKNSKISGVYLLPAGPPPPNPAELIGSKTMTELIESLKLNYDLVIFDSPPVAVVTDAALLAAAVDGVILVIKAGSTKVELVRKAKELLTNVKANILGAVLNKFENHGEGYYYYYYGEDGKKKKKPQNSSPSPKEDRK